VVSATFEAKQTIRATLQNRYEELNESERLDLMEQALDKLLSVEGWDDTLYEIQGLWSEVHTKHILRLRGVNSD
jgi:hypothetical protein